MMHEPLKAHPKAAHCHCCYLKRPIVVIARDTAAKEVVGPRINGAHAKNNYYLFYIAALFTRITENSQPTRLAHWSVRGHVVFFLSWLEVTSNRMDSV
jgi:hypothetical protein